MLTAGTAAVPRRADTGCGDVRGVVEELSEMATIRTVTNPVQRLLAQLHEIRLGSAATRKEIERLQSVLRGGQKEEAQLERKLDKLLIKAGQSIGNK